MNSSEFKAIAKEKLEGKTGTLAIITLIYIVITAACGKIYEPLALIVGGPLNLGLAIVSLKVVNEESVEIKDVFSGFYNFGNAIVLYLVNSLFIFLWSLLLIVPGIIKSYSYSMSFYIMAAHPEISASEARNRSMELMAGNKMRLFKLHLSYLGWFLLSILTCGILLLWVMPRIDAATAAFYQEISGEGRTPVGNDETTEETVSYDYTSIE